MNEPGLKVLPSLSAEHEAILTPAALSMLEKLLREFQPRRQELLQRRIEKQRQIDAGERLHFLPETETIRTSEWTVAEIPPDLLDRRVEITGPVERKMIINALNSGASCFMADFEDSNSPTWSNLIDGQVNLRDAVDRTISFTNPAGKKYSLNEKTAVLMVRPRGWHLDEKHVLLDGEPISGSIFDFALYLFHNARKLLDQGSGPYLYLPKLQSHLEARLWNDVFNMAQDEIGIPRGSIRATVLLETLPAAFEMHEILWELRDHSAGLNCGRWDYIFSIIKTQAKDHGFTLPDRGLVTMTTRCMHSYSLAVIKICHQRRVHAMGGMAAQIPIKGDPAANERALAKVREDKIREAGDGHDGTWVAHPGLVGIAMRAFNEAMPTPNQIDKKRDDVEVSADDLLAVPQGEITEQGIRHNIDVGIQYMEAWLAGNGCVPIYNLMEDAATAEISRSQLWQWLHHPGVKLSDGTLVTKELVHRFFSEGMEKLQEMVGATRFAAGKYELARQLIEEIAMNDEFTEFMTLVGYEHLD